LPSPDHHAAQRFGILAEFARPLAPESGVRSNRIPRRIMTTPSKPRLHSGTFLSAAFLLLATGIGALWYSAISAYETAVLRERGRELQAIAESRIDFVRLWLEERRGDAAVLAGQQLVARTLAPRAGRAGAYGAEDVAYQLEAIREAYHYKAVTLLDRAGNRRAGAGPLSDFGRRATTDAALSAMAGGQVVVARSYHPEPDGRHHIDIDIAAPVADGSRPGTPVVGALAFHLDSRMHLDPLLRRWPASSASGETFLFEGAGTDIIYLTSLRHAEAETLRRRTDEAALPAAMAASGGQGFVEGLDYRGVAVLAAIGQVPDMPWYVVAKVDREEVLAPVRREALWSAMLSALLALALGLAMFAWWRRSRSELALAQLAAAKDALAASEAHYRFLFEGSPLPMWIFDLETLAFLEVNDAALAQYGYSREEFLAMNLRDIRPPGQIPALEKAVRDPDRSAMGGLWTHRRKDGSLIEVAIWRQDMDYAGRPARIILAEDVTERIRAESMLRTFLDAAPGVSALLRPDGVILVANEVTARALGQAPETLVGRNIFDLLPREAAMRRQHWLARVVSERRPMRFEEYTNGRWFEYHAVPVVPEGAEVSSVAWVAIEVTKQRQAEQERLDFARRQRDTLVKEVHHRIKNHLQGLVGLLRRHARQNPELGALIGTAVAQINAISIVHGLQGRTEPGLASLRGLVAEIADFLGGVTGVALALKEEERQCFHHRPCAAETPCKWALAQEESVPVALIVNELMTNALRHREGTAPPTLELRCDEQGACLALSNAGRLDPGLDFADGRGLGTGLNLVRSLQPPTGVEVCMRSLDDGRVETRLALEAPALVPTVGA
jgi:PAS domain S-box-containing protein